MRRAPIALLLLLAIALLCSPAWAATVVHEITTATTTNAATYASGAFTPGAGDLIVCFATVTATVSTGTMTDSQSLGMTSIASRVKNTSADKMWLFVSNAAAAAVSTTVTMDVTGDNGSGAVIQCASVTGMSRYGSSAVLQSAGQDNQAASTTPAPVFASACLTGNPTLGLVNNATNPAGMTPPTSWTELDPDTGYATPTTGAEYVARDSGFTGTTITWGSTSASAFGSIIVELDTSAAPAGGSRPVVVT